MDRGIVGFFMTNISLSWSNFKYVVDDRKLSIQWIDDGEKYHLYLFDGLLIANCFLNKDDGSDTNDFEVNYKSKGNRSLKSEVVTQFEKDDKVLKLFRAKAQVDQNSIALIEIKVPGDPETEGRFVDSGMVWFDIHNPDDQIQILEIVDIDNIYGYGAGTILKKWHDDSADNENQGWYVPSTNSPLQVTSLGGYGFIPSGTYIRIKAKKGQNQTSGTLYLNIKWGKEE